ncbi:MAG: hypothetical protein JW963_03220 [Anaerolineales bacterium]|nr:hypothetical protein [Anaerolineales bacterium]
MNKFRFILIVSIAFALLLTATQAFASPVGAPHPRNTPGAVATQKAEEKANGPKGKRENFKGTVEAVSATSLTLTLRDGSSVTIGLSAETRIKVPGMKGATIDAIQPGMEVMLQAIRDQSGNLTARSIMVKPGKPSKVHRVGWVTAYAPGESITIQAHDGNIYTFALAEDVKILPADRVDELTVGSRVTIIAPRNPATPQGTANGIVIHPQGSGAGSQPTTP